MSRAKLVVLALSLILGQSLSDRIRYDNHRVYEVLPRTVQHIRDLAFLENDPENIRFLSALTAVDKTVNVLVSPHKNNEFTQYLDSNEIFYEVVEWNFQRLLDAEIAEFKTRSTSYDWTGYHTLNETYDWLRSLAEQFPSTVQTIVGGKTYEGREILGVKVSFKSGNKGIFIEGGIHAREWISPATVTYILNELLTSTDTTIRDMAERYDWYIFPHVNPDGFVYTHTNDRLWRKTRSPGQNCYGADPNRNWGFNWMVIGASGNECSETYAGKSAFSEIEMRTLSEYITSLKGKIHTYLAFHSFSQLMLYPYGHTAEPAPHDAHLEQIAIAAINALARRFGTTYKYGSTYLAIYPAAGSSPDWAYGTQDIPVAYTYELRPASSVNGFVLPSSQIIPTALETMDSLVALTSEARALGYL